MLKYFPFERDGYELTMNARAGVDALIEVDAETYCAELALKDDILAADDGYYFQCPPEAVPLAWDALALVLPDMARHFPQHFTLRTDGDRWTWTNGFQGTTHLTLGEDHSLPLPVLDWLGRQVQEDLLLMADGPDDLTFAAGHLCFGSGWSLDEKMGMPFGQIHGPVPEFAERIGRSSHLMMQRLKPHRPTARLNGTLSGSAQLNQSPRLALEWKRTSEGITAQNTGERCFLRTERQTFSRLPQTNGILFTIRTYVHSIAEVAADPARLRRLLSVVNSIPKITLEYKNMAPYADAVVNYLETRCRALDMFPECR